MTSRILLQHKFAMGDAVLFTALCRDIHLAYPGRFDIMVDTHYREMFDHNPHVTLKPENPGNIRRIPISYRDGIKASAREKIHMLSWYHRDFGAKTGLKVPVTAPCGDLHLTAVELRPRVPGRYWVLMAGGKSDVTVKIWRHSHWQQTVELLRQQNIICVQAGSTHPDHIHQPLDGVVNLLGKTKGARELMSLIANAEGVICPVTGAMHMAACFDKPCVVIGGGREAPWWESYANTWGAFGGNCRPVRVSHRFLHTIGQLDCCRTAGCWKHRTVPLGRRDEWDRADRICRLPVITSGQASPRCMDMITPSQVVDSVMMYYADGTLPPVDDAGVGYNFPAVTAAVASPVEIKPPVELLPPDAPPRDHPHARDPDLIDHPIIGGKLTVCVLCYGDHYDLARDCFDSILQTLPVSRLDLRVGLNAVCDRTRALVQSLPVSKIYETGGNVGKYKRMREMFHDAADPVTTPYLLWLDDDAKAVSVDWANDLCRAIVTNHPQGARIYGAPFIHNLQPFITKNYNPVTWFKSAAWWRNRPLLSRGTLQPTPNGTCIKFAVGWAWAMATEMITKADIPDQRLVFNGGDIAISEAVRQAGGHLKIWNPNKTLFWCPPKEHGGRRGVFTNLPWNCAEAAAGQLQLERAKF